MLTKIKNFVKTHISWITLGLCVAIFAMNLRACIGQKGPRKGPAEAHHVAP